jgi:hypothetical protein
MSTGANGSRHRVEYLCKNAVNRHRAYACVSALFRLFSVAQVVGFWQHVVVSRSVTVDDAETSIFPAID